MPRPAEGTYWTSPEDWSRYPQVYLILPPAEDSFGMVAALTTRSYTREDQYGFRDRVPAGQRTLLRPEDFGTRLLPAAVSSRQRRRVASRLRRE